MSEKVIRFEPEEDAPTEIVNRPKGDEPAPVPAPSTVDLTTKAPKGGRKKKYSPHRAPRTRRAAPRPR